MISLRYKPYFRCNAYDVIYANFPNQGLYTNISKDTPPPPAPENLAQGTQIDDLAALRAALRYNHYHCVCLIAFGLDEDVFPFVHWNTQSIFVLGGLRSI